MFFDHYPYTNFHNVNLDWVLQAVKAWGTMVEQNNQNFINLDNTMREFRSALETDWTNFQNTVNQEYADWASDIRTQWVTFWNEVRNYLRDLDVSEEINAKLEDMLTSGELSPYFVPYIENWLEENITPTTPVIDASLSISGAGADAKVTGEAIGKLNNGLIAYNAFNLCAEMSKTPSEDEGITYTWNSDGSCTIHGTATAVTFYDMFRNSSALPNGISAGDSIRIKYNSTNVMLRIYDYSTSTPSQILSTNEDSIVTIPDTCTGLIIRLWIARNSIVNETVNPIMLNTYTNEELTERTDQLIPKGSVPRRTDIDTITELGEYFLNSNYDYVNIPMPNNSASTLEVFKGINSIIVQRITRYNSGEQFIRSSNTNGSFVNRTWYGIQSNYIVTKGDTTDRTDEIQTILNSKGVCYLGAGEFYVTGIDMPANAMLEGRGEGTVIKLLNSVTEGYTIKLSAGCKLSNIKFMGGDAIPTNINGVNVDLGSRHCLEMVGALEQPCIVNNCSFFNYDGSALYAKNNGGITRGYIIMSDCFIKNCMVGLNLALVSEYNKFSNIIMNGCNIACINNGGNNVFTGCTFQGVVGFYIDGSQSNSGHGTCNGCTFNHINQQNQPSTLGGGDAIKIENLTNGFIFDSCQLWYGWINVSNARGIMVSNSQIGDGRQNPHVTQTGNYPLFLNGCIFHQLPTLSGSIIANNCYLDETGAPVSI